MHAAYGTAATLRKGRAKLMRHKTLLGALVGAVLALAAGCTSSSTQEHKVSTQEKASAQEHKAYAPHINPSEFSTSIDNEYLPMKPGTTFVYEGGAERDEMTVTNDTKKVMGVECVVVDDRAWEDGKLIEQTYDWFAQDKEGSVWYFGEDTREYENGKVVSTKGSWEAGVDGAKPGIIMQAHPKVGQVLPSGVLQRRGRGHGEGAKLERISHSALRLLRSCAGNQGVDATRTQLRRAQVLRSWGGPGVRRGLRTGRREGWVREAAARWRSEAILACLVGIHRQFIVRC